MDRSSRLSLLKWDGIGKGARPRFRSAGANSGACPRFGLRLRAGSIFWFVGLSAVLLLVLVVGRGLLSRSSPGARDMLGTVDTYPSECAPGHACRFWGMIGPAPQAGILEDQLVSGTNCMMELAQSNPDGWGLTYYSPGLQAAGLDHPITLRGGPRANHEFDWRYKAAVAEMLNLGATCAVVHVRSASSGHTGIPDPHPFRRGNLVFGHNGTLNTTLMTSLLEQDDPKYLEKHPPDYENAYVDSELYFLYVLKIRDKGVERGSAAVSHSLRDAIPEAVLLMYDAGAIQTAANCIIADGDTLYALRFDKHDQSRYKIHYKEVPGAWVAASEPVGTDTTGWKALPAKSLGVFTITSPPDIVTVFPPEEPWPSVEATKVDDDTLGLSEGNGDGGLDAGETIELSVILHNEGGVTATQVSAVLQTQDSLAVVLDSTASFPDLPPGEKGQSLAPFVLAISPEVPAYFNVNCTLRITAGPGSPPQVWYRTFQLCGAAPDIRHYSHRVDDGQDGHLEPGEEADLHVWLHNWGGEAATSLIGNLSTTTPGVQITQGQAAVDTLEVGEIDSLMPPFHIDVLPTCPDPEILQFDLGIEADWGISANPQFEIPVGGFVDNMEGGQGEWMHEPGLPGYGDAWHLSSLRNHTLGGLRSWKCGAPDSGVVYDNLLDAVLISPAVTLALHTKLRFWHWIRAELVTGVGHFGKASDGGIIEASINGGSWQQIYPSTGYDYQIAPSSPPGPLPTDTPVFSGWFYWRQAVFEINGHAGSIQFRFRFGSDGDSQGNWLEGWYIDDVEILGSNQASGAIEVHELPLRPALMIGGPSPFQEQTAILYDVVRAGDVQLSILDLEGRLVRRLIRGRKQTGRYRVVWDGLDGAGRPVPSGLYFYRLRSQADGFEEVRRIIRLR